MGEPPNTDRRRSLADRYVKIRRMTDSLAAPLSPEDQMVQSMPDVSPTKWHRGHTSWFFETFVLETHQPDYRVYHPDFGYIFNSYYETVGARHPRPDRGLISRPSAAEVATYRRAVDDAMADVLDRDVPADALDLIELGTHHEQQHQELLLMDIKHVLSCNPLRPVYRPAVASPSTEAYKAGWIEHQGGTVEVGHTPGTFAFDNEEPRHETLLTPFALADRPVTCGEWLTFIEDGGYQRPELWLSDGWAVVQSQGWGTPLYWSVVDAQDAARGSSADGGRATRRAPCTGRDWSVFTLGGERPLDPSEPVCHVSYYEADAFAHWAGARLPTESEWEAIAATRPAQGNLLDSIEDAVLHPSLSGDSEHLFGDVWEWTASAYSPYPGFRPAPGAVGEYNGKFMVNQYVLRGGCCVTPADHIRSSYRNFFPPGARWPFTGVRLARDL